MNMRNNQNNISFWHRIFKLIIRRLRNTKLFSLHFLWRYHNIQSSQDGRSSEISQKKLFIHNKNNFILVYLLPRDRPSRWTVIPTLRQSLSQRRYPVDKVRGQCKCWLSQEGIKIMIWGCDYFADGRRKHLGNVWEWQWICWFVCQRGSTVLCSRHSLMVSLLTPAEVRGNL